MGHRGSTTTVSALISFLRKSTPQAALPHPTTRFQSLGVANVRHLSLEESCRDHATFMVQRAVNQNSSELSGHALMMTCPSHNTIVNSLDNKGMPVDKDARFAHEMPNLPNADLNAMMIASSNLDLNGEVTPVMALKMIRDDKRYPMMTLAHFESLKEKLKTRSRCYGYVVSLITCQWLCHNVFKYR